MHRWIVVSALKHTRPAHSLCVCFSSESQKSSKIRYSAGRKRAEDVRITKTYQNYQYERHKFRKGCAPDFSQIMGLTLAWSLGPLSPKKFEFWQTSSTWLVQELQRLEFLIHLQRNRLPIPEQYFSIFGTDTCLVSKFQHLRVFNARTDPYNTCNCFNLSSFCGAKCQAHLLRNLEQIRTRALILRIP